MRIDWIRIPSYRNLQAFSVDFNEQRPTTVLIGRNGSGKSNLIEAIVEIFRELETGGVPDFSYTLQYTCRGQVILLDGDPLRRSRRLEIKVAGKPVTLKSLLEDGERLLPNYVFAYYSGWSSRLERQFDRPTRKHYERILKSSSSQLPLRRLFFCRKDYSQLVLLAFFLSNLQRARQLLADYLGVRRFESALFVLKRPWWRGTGAPNRSQLSEGDPRFWYARGAFKGFLDKLWSSALAPLRNTEAVERDVRRQAESTERLYLFIKNEQELARLEGGTDDPKTLFGYLESLFLCDLIDEVRVTVERTDGSYVKFTQMSEGEQQLLTVLGLLLFTQNDESLYLLDEPDTHLNPVWTYDFLRLIQESIREDMGQLIIATHNPLMIGGLARDQVRILQAEQNGVVASEPDIDPIGVGVEGLLKSELYGLRTTLAPEIVALLDRHYQLLGDDSRSEAESEELRQVARKLNDLGVVRTHPNPYFEHFANAMSSLIPQGGGPLTAEEIHSQAQLAQEVLEEVIRDESGEQGRAGG